MSSSPIKVDIIAELVAAFPAAFTPDPTLVRPLKLGIKDDLYAHSAISHRRITAALRSYCNSVHYLNASSEGAVRIDLTGAPEGAVTATEARHATECLAKHAKVPVTRGSKVARSLGFGARIVSGYLYNPNLQSLGSSDAGSTHAWAELYVPGAGWITFDPTNRSVGGFNLIPVAVVRDIRQAMPVSGSFVGMADAFAGMSVEVLVTS
jgi:hypothetical protein